MNASIALAENPEKTNRHLGDMLDTINTGMSRPEIENILGTPDEVRGFGLRVSYYDLTDGGKLTIAYARVPTKEFIVYIAYETPSGKWFHLVGSHEEESCQPSVKEEVDPSEGSLSAQP